MNELTLKTCRCCQLTYTPVSFDLHNLCGNCFVQFDNQKMQGRFGPLMNRIPEYYTESTAEFIKSGRCTHLADISFMGEFMAAAREHIATNTPEAGQ